MEKTYSIQGQTFSLLPNDLNLLNKAAPMIARLRKLSYQYTKDIDLTPVNEHKSRINELNTAKHQIVESLNLGREENGNEFTEEQKSELQLRADELNEKHSQALVDFSEDAEVQNLLKLKEELESYALIELLTDIDFLKPILKKILKGGDAETIDYSDSSFIGFIKDVVTDFFTVMNSSRLKF